jgi:hypothetical protein
MKVKTNLKAGQAIVIVGNVTQNNTSDVDVTQSNSVG